MSLVDELQQELVEGVLDGRSTAKAEAGTLAYVAGLKTPNYAALDKSVYVAPLPDGVLGATDIAHDGKVQSVVVNSKIPLWVEGARRFYDKSAEWAKGLVYTIVKDTTEHEYGHVLSSALARGEKFSALTAKFLETVTTYARYKTAKILGKDDKAERIKRTNPYPMAWLLASAADEVPYRGPSGEGYAAFMHDAHDEPFYKPAFRLAKEAAKKSWRNAKQLLEPDAAYAFAG